MAIRVVGVLVLLLGAAAIALAAWGLADVDRSVTHWASVAAAKGTTFDGADWSRHWRTYSVLFGLVGGCILSAGASVLRWGARALPLAASLFVLSALAPWLYEWLGLANYGFERPGVSETVIAFGVAIGLLLWHLRLRRSSRNGT